MFGLNSGGLISRIVVLVRNEVVQAPRRSGSSRARPFQMNQIPGTRRDASLSCCRVLQYDFARVNNGYGLLL